MDFREGRRTKNDEENLNISTGKYSKRDEQQFKEAAYFLVFWSILVMNEGVVRFIQHGQPAAPDLFPGCPSRFWGPFLGGLFEVIFGTFGLAVGLAGAVCGYYSKPLTYSFMAVQTLLGWYVFIDYVFIIPAFRIGEETPMAGMNASSSRAVGILGILSSVTWCLALQGGQFIWITRMIAYSRNSDFMKQKRGMKMRAVFWNMNYLLAGVFSTIAAGIIINQRGTGIGKVFFAPPIVGRIPIYLLVTGIIMIIWPLIGIFISVTNRLGLIRKYVVASFFVFIFVHVHYTIGQLGYISGNPAPPPAPAAGAALHNHLIFMLTFLGPYFMLKQEAEQQI